jgi:hypothetical protein
MPSPVVRFLITILFIVTGFIALRWLDTHLTTMLENRLTQIMNEAVSGIR